MAPQITSVLIPAARNLASTSVPMKALLTR